MSDRILVVDDEEGMRLFLREALKKRGYEVEAAGDAESALAKLAKEAFDLIIMDVKLPGMNGIEATARIKDQDPRAVVIVITAHATTEAAYQALEAGAYDFFTKPVHLKDLDVVVKRGLERRHLLKELETLREGLRSTYEFSHIIGRSGPIQDVLHMVSKVIDTDATVLLYGESGTGKELLAQAIHHHSHRCDKPFVTLNCAAIPEGLLESELFGYERGAFTGAFTRKLGKFELAHGGTLFLDEVGDLSLAAQAKTLRAIQEKEFERVGGTQTLKVDVRLIAATNKDLVEAVRHKQFREDFYFRLNVISVRLPPLWERREDIPPLVEHFLAKSNAKFKKGVRGLSKQALDLLLSYDWPGNIRELTNCIERAVLLAETETITTKDLPLAFQSQEEEAQEATPAGSQSLREVLHTAERELVLAALRKSEGSQVNAAQRLGVSDRTLWYLVKKHRIDVEMLKPPR